MKWLIEAEPTLFSLEREQCWLDCYLCLFNCYENCVDDKK